MAAQCQTRGGFYYETYMKEESGDYYILGILVNIWFAYSYIRVSNEFWASVGTYIAQSAKKGH